VTKTAHKFLIRPKQPMARSKTAHSYIQNGSRTKMAHEAHHTVYY